MIFNLRGTNGSGKSTIARRLTELPGTQPITLAGYTTRTGKPRTVPGYLVPALKLVVVGNYKIACGGCDAIMDQEVIEQSILEGLTSAENVFFEGMVVSGLFGRYDAFDKATAAVQHSRPYVWAYLDTPIQRCLAQIQIRNGGKPIKEKHVYSKDKSVRSTRRKAEAAGHTVITINHQQGFEQVLAILRSGKVPLNDLAMRHLLAEEHRAPV